jgi:hypothetical protein
MAGSYLLIMAVIQRVFGVVELREAAIIIATLVLIRSMDVFLFWRYMTRSMDMRDREDGDCNGD